MTVEVKSEADMRQFGAILGALMNGGEIIELLGDVGSGKTILVKGIADGLGVDENVQSPSFLITGVYQGKHGTTLAHYDFYRLSDPGIMMESLGETMHDTKTVTAIEWADIVDDILPEDRLTVRISTLGETSRRLVLQAGGNRSNQLLEKLGE